MPGNRWKARKVVSSLKEEQKFTMEKNSQHTQHDTEEKIDEVGITRNCLFKPTLGRCEKIYIYIEKANSIKRKVNFLKKSSLTRKTEKAIKKQRVIKKCSVRKDQTRLKSIIHYKNNKRSF